MNDSRLRELLSRFETQNQLSVDDCAELERGLEKQPDLVGEVLDRRAVDGLLKLFAEHETDDEQFIRNCIEKISGSPFSSEENQSEDSQKALSDHAVALAAVAQREQQSRSARRDVPSKTPVVIWLAAAASLLIATGTWSLLSWSDSNGTDDEVVSKPVSPAPALLETEAPPVTPDESLADLNSPESDQLVANEESAKTKKIEPNPETDKPLLAGHGEPRDTELAGDEKLFADPPMVIPSSADQKNSAKRSIATIQNGKEAVWDVEFLTENTGPGKFKLIDGNASVKLNDGVLIRMLAPAELELISGDSVRFEQGNFIAEIPRTVDGLSIGTPYGTFQNPVNARLQLIVEPANGVESLVTRGRISLVHAESVANQDQIELSKNGLYQSVVRPLEDQPAISQVLMARGKNDFQGQIGTGDDALKLKSPKVFANVLKRIAEQPNTNPGNNEFQTDWAQFAREFQALAGNMDSPQLQHLMNKFLGQTNVFDPDQKMSDVLANGSTNFQGSLSINGVEQKFNSREEYEKARQQMLNGSLPLDSNNSGQTNMASDFNGVINVNGRRLEFSSPEIFKSLRKKMTR